MDAPMYAFAYIAAVAMTALGIALLVAPVRTTGALHEWYIVPPAVRPHQKVRAAACRLVGAILLAGGGALAASITQVIFKLV
jgi:hypothetical protein